MTISCVNQSVYLLHLFVFFNRRCKILVQVRVHMQEVKVTTIFHCRIKHGLFPSLCIGDNHGTVLKFPIPHGNILVLQQSE